METIKNKVQLTEEIGKKLPQELVQRIEYDGFELMADYMDDEYFVDQDYIFATVIIDNEQFTMIHGFPGDNPQGVIYNDDKIFSVGECIDCDGKIGEWYDNITNNMMDYNLFCLERK